MHPSHSHLIFWIIGIALFTLGVLFFPEIATFASGV